MARAETVDPCKLRNSYNLKFDVYYKLKKRIDAVRDGLLRAFERAERGRYGVDAFEARRLENRSKYERYHPSKKLKMGDHTEVREQKIFALVASVAEAFGTSATIELDPSVVRSAARRGIKWDWHGNDFDPPIDLHQDDPVMSAAALRDRDGAYVGNLAGLMGSVMHMGLELTTVDEDGNVVGDQGLGNTGDTWTTTISVHPELHMYANFSTLAGEVARVHDAVGARFMIDAFARSFPFLYVVTSPDAPDKSTVEWDDWSDPVSVEDPVGA